MKKLTRIKYIFQSLIMLFFVFILLLIPEDGYLIIVGIISIYMIIYAINQLLYFLTLARYMVGGMLILCKSLVVLNLGISIGYLSTLPQVIVMTYLVVGLIISGLIDILRALEKKKQSANGWRFKLVQGLITVGMAVCGMFFVSSTEMVVRFFCMGIVSSAITKLTEAFRKTAIVYIQ